MIPIIIGVPIGLFILFIIMVIIVVCVRKRQHKNNDGNMAYEKPLELSNTDGSSDGSL
jgi:heme/copper-type cytochrome/quinol oxidase subunit 2